MSESSGTERPYTEKRDGIEWDIDANLPMYTNDLLWFADRWVAGGSTSGGQFLGDLIRELAEEFGGSESPGTEPPEHPAVHWERIGAFRVTNPNGKELYYRQDQVAVILKTEGNAEFRWEIVEEPKQPRNEFLYRKWSRAELKEIIAAALDEDAVRRNLEEFKREGRGDERDSRGRLIQPEGD